MRNQVEIIEKLFLPESLISLSHCQKWNPVWGKQLYHEDLEKMNARRTCDSLYNEICFKGHVNYLGILLYVVVEWWERVVLEWFGGPKQHSLKIPDLVLSPPRSRPPPLQQGRKGGKSTKVSSLIVAVLRLAPVSHDSTANAVHCNYAVSLNYRTYFRLRISYIVMIAKLLAASVIMCITCQIFWKFCKHGKLCSP